MSPIEMVRHAEQKSDEIIAGANNNADQIIESAQKAVEAIAADGAKASADRYAGSIAAAHQINRALMEELVIELDSEIQSLKASVGDKTAKAVELVYRSLVPN